MTSAALFISGIFIFPRQGAIFITGVDEQSAQATVEVSFRNHSRLQGLVHVSRFDVHAQDFEDNVMDALLTGDIEFRSNELVLPVCTIGDTFNAIGFDHLLGKHWYLNCCSLELSLP